MADGDITDALLVKLAARMEDVDQRRFTAAAGWKLVALNEAQIQLATLLDKFYLSDFETSSSAVSLATGGVTFAGIASTGILKGSDGIISAVFTISSTTRYPNRIDIRDRAEYDDTASFRKYSDLQPIYWVFGKVVYCKMTTYTGSTGIFNYLKIPADMTTDIDPVFSSDYHGLLLDIAEGKLWKIDREFERSNAIFTNAYEQIKLLNDKLKG